jgi:hypothetical protein
VDEFLYEISSPTLFGRMRMITNEKTLLRVMNFSRKIAVLEKDLLDTLYDAW